MDEVSAKAELATAEPGLSVSVPKREVVAALEGEGADLVLDVVRSNGDREERRVVLALDEETLRRLVEQEGEQIMIAIDPESLAVSFDDVEAHGMREVGATLAVLVATAAGGAGMAQAHPADGSMPAGGHAVAATVQSEEAGMPRAMPSDYAATQAAADIEQIRAAQPPPAEATDPTSAIESVRVGGTAVPDPSSAIEQVRTGRTAGDTQVRTGRTAGDTVEGSSLSAPEAGVAVAIAGGAMLTIAAAAFALRGRREPRPA
jgi:hypothetical protein